MAYISDFGATPTGGHDGGTLKSSSSGTRNGGNEEGFDAQSGAGISIRSLSFNGQGATVPTVVKDITFWGGLCLLICNNTGPGAVNLPLVAQSAGWIPALIGFLLVGFLSFLSSVFICEAMTEVPDNDHFQNNVEFSNLVYCFLGRRYQVCIQVICFIAMQTTNIASIAICSQLFDNLLIRIFHRTCAIQVYPTAAAICVTEQLPSSSPFSGTLIMSTGSLVALVLIVPLCLMNLSENIWLQIGSCIVILLIFVQWIVTFFKRGLEPARVPPIGSDLSQMFGSILFNYAFVTAVPSLANARKPNVSIHKTVGTSVSTMTFLFILVSILGGMAYEIPANSTMVHAINSSPGATTLSQITGYTFPIAALVTSIPVNIIVLRYNLIQSGACNKSWSNILACMLPWLVAIPCMTGSGLTVAVGWSSLFFVSAANFVIPFILYLCSQRFKKRWQKLDAMDKEQQGGFDREMVVAAEGEGVPRTPSNQGQLPQPAEQDSDTSNLEEQPQSFEETAGARRKNEMRPTLDLQDNETLVSRDSTLFPTRDEHSFSGRPLGGGSRGVQTQVLAPPFLSGNNYAIPGFGACGARSSTHTHDSSLDVGLQDTSVRGSLRVMESQDQFPQHNEGFGSVPKLQALPRWFPVSGVVVAWIALTLLLIGICSTIVIKIVQEA